MSDTGDAMFSPEASMPSNNAPPRGEEAKLPHGAPAPDPFHLTLLVIGKVEAHSARILVETLESGDLSVTLRRTRRNVRALTGDAAQFLVAESEADNDPEVQAASRDPAVRQTQSQVMVAGRARVFKFSNLEHNARYTVNIHPLAHGQPQSAFHTLIHDWKAHADYPQFRCATVSCNLLSETLSLKQDQVDLWSDLSDRVGRGELDYVLHIGDQVYADEPRSNDHVAPPVSAFAPVEHSEEGKGGETLREKDQLVFKKCLRLIEKAGATTPADYAKLAPQICELYRVLYRETWSHPPTARVLSNIPNLMILDDHDFVDNWGSHPEHRDPNSKEFAIGVCARQVYYEYQGSLYRDVDLTAVQAITDDHHFHKFGEFGVMFTESRGALSFRYLGDAETAPFLGKAQWVDIEAALAPGGFFSDVRQLIVVCPCPVVYLPHGLNQVMEPVVEDAQGHWASAPFRAEQTRMLNLALEWQEGAGFADKLKAIEPPPKDTSSNPPKEEHLALRTTYPSLLTETVNPESGVRVPPLCASDRRLTFVGGDVHVGGHTRLYKHGHLVLEQLVSSAMANHVLPRIAFAIASMVQNAYTELLDGWSFCHQPYTRMRNYGLIDLGANRVERKPTAVTHIISAPH